MDKKVYLILENGTMFEGKSFGFEGEAVGELVFTTSMTGYLETITDPSCYGQLVIQTFPLIGNYGVIPEDFEGEKPFLSGYIVREICTQPSNFRSQGLLEDYLKKHKIPGIYGIDTRALTKIVREHGVMNAKISFTASLTDDVREYKILNSVEKVSSAQRAEHICESPERTVVLWDFGAKRSIERKLLNRGCRVIVVPWNTTAEEIMEIAPDGIMLSNGPGDPADNPEIVKQLSLLTDKGIPIFGICLGHQLLALANGAKTEKLKYGHRGGNQPAVYRDTGRVYITSQNHGYTVVSESLPEYARISFSNGNDHTCEGIEYLDRPAFSVQFHPEVSAGPLDTGFLFDRFIDMMKEVSVNAAEK